MNLREELLKEHSKVQCNKIVQWVGNSEKRFEELFHLFLTDIYRLPQHVDIPEKFRGEIMDICFGYLTSPKEALAIKVFSMTVLGNLSKIYPEIIPELKVLIEEQLPHQ